MAKLQGTGGLQKRRKDGDVAARDLLITPEGAWDWFFERFEPLPGSVICDPATAGFKGFSAGGKWAAMHGREAELSDLEPLSDRCRFSGAPIIQGDYCAPGRPPMTKRLRTHLTNPPYNLVSRGPWLRLALEECEEVILLMRQGFLATKNELRRQWLHSYWQPAQRMAFELHPEEGERRLAFNDELKAKVQAGKLTKAQYERQKLDVTKDPSTITGYRCSGTGVDHGFVVYRRGYTGVPGYIIEHATFGATSKQLDLVANLERDKRTRITTNHSLNWAI